MTFIFNLGKLTLAKEVNDQLAHTFFRLKNLNHAILVSIIYNSLLIIDIYFHIDIILTYLKSEFTNKKLKDGKM